MYKNNYWFSLVQGSWLRKNRKTDCILTVDSKTTHGTDKWLIYLKSILHTESFVKKLFFILLLFLMLWAYFYLRLTFSMFIAVCHKKSLWQTVLKWSQYSKNLFIIILRDWLLDSGLPCALSAGTNFHVFFVSLWNLEAFRI